MVGASVAGPVEAVTDTEMPPNVAACIDAAARFLADQPGGVERILAAHRRREDGRCVTCTRADHWPCTMVAIARRANAYLSVPGPGASESVLKRPGRRAVGDC